MPEYINYFTKRSYIAAFCVKILELVMNSVKLEIRKIGWKKNWMDIKKGKYCSLYSKMQIWKKIKGNGVVCETFYNWKFMFVCYTLKETSKVITFLTEKIIVYIAKDIHIYIQFYNLKKKPDFFF